MVMSEETRVYTPAMLSTDKWDAPTLPSLGLTVVPRGLIPNKIGVISFNEFDE